MNLTKRTLPGWNVLKLEAGLHWLGPKAAENVTKYNISKSSTYGGLPLCCTLCILQTQTH